MVIKMICVAAIPLG